MYLYIVYCSCAYIRVCILGRRPLLPNILYLLFLNTRYSDTIKHIVILLTLGYIEVTKASLKVQLFIKSGYSSVCGFPSYNIIIMNVLIIIIYKVKCVNLPPPPPSPPLLHSPLLPLSVPLPLSLYLS